MDIAKIVGNNLKNARKLKGLTQKQVAEMLNKYQSDYSEYESGKIQLDYDKIVFYAKDLISRLTIYLILIIFKRHLVVSFMIYVSKTFPPHPTHRRWRWVGCGIRGGGRGAGGVMCRLK